MTELRVVQDYLDGSPYSIPDDQEGRAALINMLERAGSLEQRCMAVRRDVADQFMARIAESSRTTEIFESNAIEGKTATLAETHDILTQRHLLDADAALARYTLHEALNDEPKVKEVIGLAAARILVDHYTEDPTRPVGEADLREMHSLIMAGERSAGRYKQYLNRIEGSEHTPVPPSDVPAHMDALVRWLRSADSSPLWKSVVAHAWLTHIHPFDDGNGRMARLLANYVLGFGNYPPLIVKSSSDRGRYISALAHSDLAGDVTPLARLFVRVLNRQIKLMEDPDFSWVLFQKDLRIREDSIYKRWQSTLSRFMQEVGGHLALSRMLVVPVGTVAASDFELLRKRDRFGNTWLVKIVPSSGGRGMLVWVGHTTPTVHRQLKTDQVFPSFFVSEENPEPKGLPRFLPRVRGLPPRHDELCLIADEDWAVLRRGDRSSRVRLHDAAELWAGLLAGYLDAMRVDDAHAREGV